MAALVAWVGSESAFGPRGKSSVNRTKFERSVAVLAGDTLGGKDEKMERWERFIDLIWLPKVKMYGPNNSSEKPEQSILLHSYWITFSAAWPQWAEKFDRGCQTRSKWMECFGEPPHGRKKIIPSEEEKTCAIMLQYNVCIFQILHDINVYVVCNFSFKK